MTGSTTLLIAADHLLVLVVRKEHAELAVFHVRLAKRWKGITSLVARRHPNMAIRTDRRRRPFAREELGAMTIETSIVRGKLSHVGKRSITLPHVFPILGGKLVAAVTCDLLRRDVGRV